MTVVIGPFSLERIVIAVEKVRQRLLRAAAALQAANIPYAVAGGNAVALWVSRVDEAAVRNTRDVDVLIRRSDFDGAKAALESAGFVYRHVAGLVDSHWLDKLEPILTDRLRELLENPEG